VALIFRGTSIIVFDRVPFVPFHLHSANGFIADNGVFILPASLVLVSAPEELFWWAYKGSANRHKTIADDQNGYHAKIS